MPAGLDGNPDPIRSPQRDAVLSQLVDRIVAVAESRVLVGIDGAPGTGKSTMADELAARLRDRDLAVIRSTTDAFHLPRAERYRRGPTSPHGYYLDSHDLDAIRATLLQPFAEGADRVQIAAFDEPSDTPAPVFADLGPGPAVLVVDGLFLLRPELAPLWHVTGYLQADERRERAWTEYLYADLPADGPARQRELEQRLARARWPRYHEGWQLYLDSVDPAATATVVIDNDDFATPTIRRR